MFEDIILWLGTMGLGFSVVFLLLALFIYLLPSIIIACAIISGFKKMHEPIELEVIKEDENFYYLEKKYNISKKTYDNEYEIFITPIGIFSPIITRVADKEMVFSFLYFKK